MTEMITSVIVMTLCSSLIICCP